MYGDRRAGVSIVAALVLGVLLGLAPDAHAQADVLPGAKRPELAPFAEDEEPSPPLDLPPLPRREGRQGGLAAGVRVVVREFQVEGSSVFSQQELAELTEPWTGHAITSEDLLEVREAITQRYVQRGYLTSGALIPDQSIVEGVVTVQVVEGELTSIEVRGTRRFRPGYFRTRLRRAGRAPVNVLRLETQLQRFQRDPRVRRVHARLEPGERRGESVLLLEVEESRFYGLALAFSNENSPSVGSYTGVSEPVLWNLAGWGDEWRGKVEIADGLTEADAAVSVPLPPFDTLVELHFQYNQDQVVEDPFDVLDIENESFTYGFTVTQPLLRSELQTINVGVTGEYRTSETRLEVAGGCFAFVADTSDCKAKVSVVRLFADWVLATRRNVVAARSMLSVGVDLLGSTQRAHGLPDSQYVAWLGQVQWAHRLPRQLLSSELLFRADTQLSDHPLLGIEKFAVGGLRTVRGYRENQVVRDNGVVASGELRLPLWWDRHDRPVVQIAPFIDYGRSWNHAEGSVAQTLWSVGIGLRVAPFEWLRGELYWGHAFTHVQDVGGDLQDDGIHFELTLVPF